MRAKVFIQNNSWEEELIQLIKKLSTISGLDKIRVNSKEASVSFEYVTDDAMLLVYENLYKKLA